MGLFLTLFGLAMDKPAKALEPRVKQFLESASHTESLDAEKFASLIGSATKADYLLGSRSVVAELKTLNGDPKPRIETRLKARFAQPGSPIVFGQLGMSRVLAGMADGEAISKMIHDVSARAIRRHLQKSNQQIGATRKMLGLKDALGLSILMNDREQMIDSANIGYSIKTAIETVKGGYPNIDVIWVNIECHRIRMPDGGLAYPQILITKSVEVSPQLLFVGSMIEAWAKFNSGTLLQIPHNGDWSSMQPVYEDGPPIMELF